MPHPRPSPGSTKQFLRPKSYRKTHVVSRLGALTAEPGDVTHGESSNGQVVWLVPKVNYRPESWELSKVWKGTQGEWSFELSLGVGWSLDKLRERGTAF